MVFAVRIWSFDTDSDSESGGETGVCTFPQERSSQGLSLRPALVQTPRVEGRKKIVFKLDLNSCRLRAKALTVLTLYPGFEVLYCIPERMEYHLAGSGIDEIQMLRMLRKKIRYAEILSVRLATAPNDIIPTTVRITELPEQSEKQQEDQPPPGQADSYLSQVKASLLSHPLPSMSVPLASKARPSPSPVSPPSQETPDQMQATPDHVSELPFPFAPLSSRIFWTESLADMPGHSSISGGACLPKDMELMEEEGLGGHDQLYDSAVHHLLSGIDGIGELKRHDNLHAGEQASRLKEADDTAIMLHKQVEELEAKLLMANMPERHLMDMVRVSEDGHARTKRELALMQEKMDEANRRIEYLGAAVSRYTNRIAVAKIENEKAGEKVSRASVEGETMSTTRLSPAAPRSTSLSFVPLLLLVLVSQTWRCARKALFFLDVTSYLDNLE